MKILQCHNLYQLAGGEDSVVRDERALLEAHGHEVISFTKHNDDVVKLSKLRLAAGTVWSRATARELRELVRREKPDVAHFHNTLPLMSPSAYYAVRGEGVPVVQTLHNYRMLCPEATFFRDNRICEDCLTKKIKWPAIKHACYRNSRAATTAAAAMLTVHGVIGTYRNAVDAYIACSEFTREKMIQGGLPADRLHYKPNFLTEDPGVGSGAGGFPMYLGRLSHEKGIQVLVDAWDQLDGVPLTVVGKGPLQPLVDGLVERHPDRVTYESYVSFPRLNDLLSNAAFLVLPNMTYEGFPKVVVEAYAHGVPLVASNIGAMKHIVVDGVTGRHIQYGDADDLARVVGELMNDPEQVARLRRNARDAYESSYTAERNYSRLMEIYGHAQDHFSSKAKRRARPAAVASSH